MTKPKLTFNQTYNLKFKMARWQKKKKKTTGNHKLMKKEGFKPAICNGWGLVEKKRGVLLC